MAARSLAALLLVLCLVSASLAFPNEFSQRRAAPWAVDEVAARAPRAAPSKRFADFARAATPSKRFEKREIYGAPSKRHPGPSKRAEPTVSKRYAARDAVPTPDRPSGPSKRAPSPSAALRARDVPAPSKRHEVRDAAPTPSGSFSQKRSPLEKRGIEEQGVIINVASGQFDNSEALCPGTSSACPLLGKSGTLPLTGNLHELNFECVDLNADLRSCGGCSSVFPEQFDCTKMVGAEGVACVSGQCQASTCQAGFTLQDDHTCA